MTKTVDYGTNNHEVGLSSLGMVKKGASSNSLLYGQAKGPSTDRVPHPNGPDNIGGQTLNEMQFTF